MSKFTLIAHEGLRAIAAPLSNGQLSGYIRPTIAAVYITKYCNSRCNMCDFWKGDRDPDELTAEQWGIVFSRLKAFGVGFVGVNASGEMFTRRDVFQILQHLRDLGLGFGVNSNGTLFTKTKARRLAELGPRQVTIGLDGVGNEAYLATRGLKGGFDKVSRHIDNLLEAGVRGVSIGTVLMRENIDDWVPLAEFAQAKGLAGIRYTAYHDSYFNAPTILKGQQYGGTGFMEKAATNIEALLELKRKTGIVKNSEAYLRRALEFYLQPRTYFPVPCLQGSNRIEIDVFGNVTLCSFVTEPLGNLVKQDMEAIWESAEHRNAREAARTGKCPKCFLSCYGEENLRLSAKAALPTMLDTLHRGYRLILR
ncbi:hypothetical protein B9N43_01610 [Denitratisoma sp. DHT3]|uniref:radical SAM protein n=1 Tax=Denitratisoma sp. DHT3 TaxID=1981880 RepID=UPI001198316C|nr:radical SAM protein [Denitratisoma sp. DHT3]QDX80063.1 hypothetical protein B9N43_01610 [Denitratisoma sp. DHT3]